MILAKILQECVEEFKDCSLEDIEKKYIEGEPHIKTIGVMPDDSDFDADDKPLIEILDDTKKEVGNMCDLSKYLVQKYFKEGIQQGKTEVTLKMAKSLMKTQSWTALQALKAMGTPENEISKYLTLLEEKE